MAYTLTNLRDDIRNYTEVSSNVLTDAVLNTIIKISKNIYLVSFKKARDHSDIILEFRLTASVI